MSSNTYIVHSGTGDEASFPFNGTWESGGAGYSIVASAGTISPSNTLNGQNLVAVGVITGFGYAGTPGGPSSPVFCVVAPPGTPQNYFDNVTVQLAGACTASEFFSSNADFFFDGIPTGGEDSTSWVWTIPSASALFVNAQNTTVTFDFSPPLPTMNVTANVISDSEIDLTWTDTSSPTPTANNYNVSRDGVVVAHLANTVFAYQDTGLTPSTTYSYEITGVT